MNDDIFSKLFELFNQPGPVNWKLAGEVARHLAGEREAIDPWSAEEQRELVRLAEYQLGQEAPFAVPPASDVIVVDPRQWVDLALPGFGYLAEAVAESTQGLQGGPSIPGIGATVAGMQVGSLVGGLSRAVPASFESGFPIDPPGPVLVIGSGVDRIVAASGAPARDIRLWVAAEEVAHRALFGVPWLSEHLARLVGAYAAQLLPNPEKLMKLWSEDPDLMSGQMGDVRSLSELFESEESAPHRSALEAFLTVSSGYRHLLAKRGVGNLLPALDTYGTPAPEVPNQAGLPSSDHGRAMTGAKFCADIERRYGREALDDLWQGPERLPTAGELNDPVGWAARVLLDEL
ncbi:MAG: zinc-dependent metalloprotease [Acidimicrobiia bacterium]